MFSIFRGTWRGASADTAQEVTFAKIGVEFRKMLHHFKGAKLHVFMAVALHMDESGVSHPSYDLLEKETGYGRETIARALNELCGTTINDRLVLMRWRERDDRGQYTGSNHYLLFPTEQEIQSRENPNGGIIEPEVEPGSAKEEPNSVPDGTGAEQPSPRKAKRDLLFEAVLWGGWGLKYHDVKPLPKDTHGQVNKIAGALREMAQPPDAHELVAFYTDWQHDNPTLSPIQSHTKLPLALMQWRQERTAPSSARQPSEVFS